MIHGIGRHAQEVGNWLINVEPWGRYERFRVPEGWKGDGIIARINHPAVAEAIVATGLPAVNVSWYHFSNERIAHCTGDARASGQIAAEYFLSIGFKQFGYCGPQRQLGYRDEFQEAYYEPIERAKCQCLAYAPPDDDPQAVAWNAHLDSLVAWVKQLPRPAAVLCWSTARGRQVTEACHYAGIRVPDEIAVLGGDYDELMSRISSPPLSTIDLPTEQIGYAAAQILEDMMQGKKPPKRPTLFPPTRIAVRHSTDTLAIDDEMVRDALRLIRTRAHEDIRVSDLLSELAVAHGPWSRGSHACLAEARPKRFAACGSRKLNGCSRRRIARLLRSVVRRVSVTKTYSLEHFAAAWDCPPPSFAASIRVLLNGKKCQMNCAIPQGEIDSREHEPDVKCGGLMHAARGSGGRAFATFVRRRCGDFSVWRHERSMAHQTLGSPGGAL